jgi:hypothetical protein
MAANYLAVYYLKGPHKNTHTHHLLHSMHTYMPAEGRWEAPSYRTSHWALLRGSTSATMKPMPNLMFRGWVVWLGIGLCMRIGQGPWRPPSFYHIAPPMDKVPSLAHKRKRTGSPNMQTREHANAYSGERTKRLRTLQTQGAPTVPTVP